MNGLEARYASRLELFKRGGAIRDYKFEAVKLRLASGLHYTPDFLVIGIGGEVEFHEVKGFWRDDARAKIKMAAQMYPFWEFRAVTLDRKTRDWRVETFSARTGL